MRRTVRGGAVVGVADEPASLGSSEARCDVVLATTPATDAGATYRVRVDAPPAVAKPLADCDWR